MRKLIFVLLCCGMGILSVQGQGIIGNWELGKLGLTSNAQIEKFGNLDSDYYMDQISLSKFWHTPTDNLHNTGYRETKVDGQNLSLSFTLTNSRFKDWEWKNDIRYKHNQSGTITFVGYDPEVHCDFGDLIRFSSNVNEIALESSLGRVINIVEGLNITPSMGTNIGYAKSTTSFKEEIYNERFIANPGQFNRYNTVQEGELKSTSSFNQRIFLDLRGSLVVKNRVEVFSAARIGGGYRFNSDEFNTLGAVSLNFGLNLILNKEI